LEQDFGIDAFGDEGAGGGGDAIDGTDCVGEHGSESVQAGEGGRGVDVETFDLEPALDAERERGEESDGQVGARPSVRGWWRAGGGGGQVYSLE
jgi:hypothetical protein